jgi:hypothetical protein
MRRYTNRCNVRSPIFDEIRHESEVSRRSHRESVILRGPHCDFSRLLQPSRILRNFSASIARTNVSSLPSASQVLSANRYFFRTAASVRMFSANRQQSAMNS